MTPTTPAQIVVSADIRVRHQEPQTDCFSGQYPETLIVAGHTHINAAYAWIDPANYTIAYMTETDDAIWRRLTALKQTNPGLQVWLSVGGSMMVEFG